MTPNQQWTQALIEERAAFELALSQRHQALSNAGQVLHDYQELQAWDQASEQAALLEALKKFSYAFTFVDTNASMLYESADPTIAPLPPYASAAHRGDLYVKWRQEAQQRVADKTSADVGQAGNLPETPSLGGGGLGGIHPVPLPGGGQSGGGMPAEPSGPWPLLLLAGGAAAVYALLRYLRR